MELRTKDKQPEIFPLIQQCCEHVPDATQEAISKEIERLEKDTVLTSTQHRLGITYYQTPTPVNSKSGSLEEVLSQRGLLSSCFKPSINSPLEESRISAAVGAIMDNTVQSCVMLPCCSDTVGQQSTDKQNVVKWTAKCLQRDFHVKRTLYLSFSSGNHPLIQSLEQKDHNRSLVISLGPCPAADDEVSPSCQPAPVCIPLSQSQLQDADIIAAVQQIVLPISYEFGPDFVVVCLDLFKPDLPGGPSAACIGHVLSVIQGLAMGRLLLLVSPEAMEEMEETVVECVSVLQGRPCHTVSACVPQSSTVELIKTVQDRQKAVWNVLHFREKLPPPR
ncbi:histone deacetylase 4-like [Babylonia areolata]|uniref:histone deacetylase 4-like n=1 Tax=Babylonia areolata TaxID=304850 RepID=UPI003FD4F918